MRVVVSVLVLMLVVVVAGCAAPASQPIAGGQAPTERGTGALPIVRYVNFKVYDPVYVALEQGFFERRGIQVEMVGDVLGGPTAIQAVASGDVHAGLSSLPALINANANGLPVVGVSDIQSALGDQPLEEYFVRADSAIRSVEDLRGRTAAVNLWRSSFHYTLLMALEQHSVGESDVHVVLLPFDAQSAALERGEVDCIGLMEPYASMARATYGDQFRVLFTALDVFGERQFTTHFVNRAWAKQHPQQARAFVGGVVDAIEWIAEHPQSAKPIIAGYTGIEERFVPDYRFQPDGRVVMDDVRFWLAYMRERGDVTVETLGPEDVATNQFNERVR